MKALDLAAYIVNLCIEEGNPVSNQNGLGNREIISDKLIEETALS